MRSRIATIATSIGLAVLASCSAPWAPDAALSSVDTTGYEIEDLPVIITASYARGDNVYLGLDSGQIKRASDSQFTEPWTDLGNPLGGAPRLLFASSTGVLFVSADNHPVYRSADSGATWQTCLDVPVWRMDQDDQGSLYAGDYIKDPNHIATLYKSTDAGLSWAPVFTDPANHHIHTVRWDEQAKRLYIAFGDGPARGQAYSDDRGATWQIVARGPQEGDTDVALLRDDVCWGTDNGSGQVVRVNRARGTRAIFSGLSQYVWFAVSDHNQQLYVGTVASQKHGGERAALLASPDQGQTWQKLSETAVSSGPYSQGLFAESRELSAGGWLYCTGGDEHGPRSFRVRRIQPN